MKLNNPIYIISVIPNEPSKFKNLFQSGENTLMDLLAHPGSFRYAGWDLETLDSPKIVAGEYLEVRNGDRKTIQLYEDGTLIFKMPVGPTFLGWGRREENFEEAPRLNPVALIEASANFVYFYKKLLPFFEIKPQEIIFKIEFHNMKLSNDKFIYLNPFPVNSIGWSFDDEQKPAPDENMEREIIIDSNLLDTKPGAVSYKVIEKIFLWFGIPTNKIPYIKSDGGESTVNIELISKK